MAIPLCVLIVEDSEDDAQLILRQLRIGGYDPIWKRVETGIELESALAAQPWDAIICDYTLPHLDALTALKVVQEKGRDIPFIIVSGKIGEDTAVAAMKAGAHDYLMKDRLSRLSAAVGKEIREAKGRQEHKLISQQLRSTYAKLDLTVRAAGAGTWEWDLVTGSVVWSPRMFELLGLDPSTNVASIETWRNVLHPEDMARPEQAAKQALAEHTLLSDDYRVSLPGGKIRWINFVGEGIYDEQGRAVVMAGLCWDISARKQLEHEIRERAKELKAFYHLSGIAERAGLTLEQMYQEVVSVLPSSWQYSEVACARIVLDEREFCSSNFAETSWKQVSPIRVDGVVAGKLEVGYLEDRPVADEGPFLREESQLIHAIAERIGHLTSRKRAEAALRQSEIKYRTVVENVFEGVIVFSGGEKRFCNRRYHEIVGYSAEEFEHVEFMAAVHPEDRESVHRALEMLMRTGVATAGFQCRVITKPGDHRWIEARGASIDWEGHPSIIVFVDDITASKQILHRLQESEERYRRLFEASPDGIALIGADGCIVQANEAQARMFGYESPAEMTGVHASQLVAPSSKDNSVQIMARRLKGEAIAPVQYELERRDGTRFFGEVSAAILCDAKGNVSGYTSVTHDISERLRDEAVLRESEARFKAAFMTGPDAFYWATLRDGRICEINERFETLFGYAREEVLGKTSLELGLYVNPSDRARMVAQVQEHGSVRQMEVPGRKKSGELITLSLSASVVAQSDQLFLLGVLRDITERKQVEAELSRYRGHLEEVLTERTEELVTAKSALADSIARYDNLVEHSRSIILEWDATGKILFINRWGREFFGFVQEELVGRNIVGTIVAPVDEAGNDLVEKMASIQYSPDEFYSSENENTKKNGERVWVSWTNKSIFGADGKTVKTLSVGIDRTSQRQAELELAKYRNELEMRVVQATSELAQRNRDLQMASERLVLAARAANLGVWDWDIPRNHLAWDDTMYALYGIRRGDFGGAYEAWLSTVHPDDKERLERATQDALRGEREYAPEFRVIRPDGAVRYTQASALTFRDPEGKPLRMVGVNFDTTERKLADDALRKSERMLAESQKIARLGSYALDLSTGTFETSAELDKLYGIDSTYAHTLAGWENLLHPEDRESILAYLKNDVLGRRQPFDREFRLVRPSDGETRWLHTVGQLELDTNGVPVTIRGTSQEVTERKLAEQELEERLRIETLVAELAARFVTLDIGNTDREIQAALQRICDCFDIDVVGIWQLPDTVPRTLTLTQLYRHTEGPPIPTEMTGQDFFPWIEEKLRVTGTSFAVSTPTELPPEAARDKEVFALFGVESSLCVPSLGVDGTVYGVIACNCMVRRTWTPLVVSRIEMLAHIILLAVSRDRVERTMAASRERMRLLTEMLDEAPVGVVVCNECGNLLYANRYAVELHGYATDEFNRLSLSDLVAPDFRNRIRRRLRETIETGGDSFETWHVRKDTSTVHLHVTTRRVLWQDRVVVLSVEADLTERDRSASALRESEERYRLLAERAADVVWVLDPMTGQFVYMSPSVERLRGFTVEEALAQPFKASLAPESQEEWGDKLDEGIRALARGANVGPFGKYIVNQTRKDGSSVPTELAMESIRDEATNKVLVLGVSRDITERIRAETVQQELQGQLLQAQKMEAIGSLAGGVAHDFNNLLSVILSYTGFAMKGALGNESLKEDLLEVRKAADRAVALTRQLLAFSRKQVLQPLPLDLNQITSGIEKMLRRILGEDIELILSLEPNLGSTLADPSQIEQVLMNLVVNARDAMPRGGTLTIETANVEVDAGYAEHHLSVKPGHFIQLTVTDTGAGMDEQTRVRIFEPFFTTKELGKGTGLGLSTVYGIVRQSGGDIWVYSELGYGTTFKVYLPRVQSTASVRSIRPQQSPSKFTGTETVLVVEDEEAIRRVAKRALTSAGYEVLMAASGDEALLNFEKYQGEIALVVTDVVMPRMSGRQLAERLLTKKPTIKVLYMSGYTDDAIDRHGILEAGTMFLAKPFTGFDLTCKVREALDSVIVNIVCGKEPEDKVESNPGPGPDAQALAREELSLLASSTMTSLHKAVVAARYDDIAELVESIRGSAPTVAGILRRMMKRYEYDAIRSFLNSVTEGNHGR